jgi:hypothetical protein
MNSLKGLKKYLLKFKFQMNLKIDYSRQIYIVYYLAFRSFLDMCHEVEKESNLELKFSEGA